MNSSLLACLLCSAGGLAAFAAPIASAQVLHDNRPYVTHPGGHASGDDASQLQDVTFSGNTAYGYRVDLSNYQLTDDFRVPTEKNWTLTRLRVYAYQTGAGNTPFTDASVMLWTGQPGISFVLYDGREADAFVSSTPVAYRIAESGSAPFADTTRRVHEVVIDIPSILLGSGQFWISWAVGAGNADPVYGVPVTIPGEFNTVANGTAGQYNESSGNWLNPIRSGLPNSPYLVDLAFVLEGLENDIIYLNGFE